MQYIILRSMEVTQSMPYKYLRFLLSLYLSAGESPFTSTYLPQSSLPLPTVKKENRKQIPVQGDLFLYY